MEWRLAIDRLGVRTEFPAVILLSGLSFLVASVFCKCLPWREATSATLDEIGDWLLAVVRTHSFPPFSSGLASRSGGYYLLAGFMIDLFTDWELSASAASTALGAISGISIASRIASGAIADRLGYVSTYLLSLAFVALGCCLLLLPPLPSLGLALVFFGVGLGGTATLYVPVLMSTFDPDKDTAVMGLLTSRSASSRSERRPSGRHWSRTSSHSSRRSSCRSARSARSDTALIMRSPREAVPDRIAEGRPRPNAGYS